MISPPVDDEFTCVTLVSLVSDEDLLPHVKMRARVAWLPHVILRAWGCGLCWRVRLARGHFEELCGQGLDLTLSGGGVDQSVGSGHGRYAVIGHGWMVDRAANGVVVVSCFLVTLAPSRTLDISFCCG